MGSNPVAARSAEVMLREIRALAEVPRLLIIGGGAIGSGADALYRATDVQLIGTDVYASVHTQYVADAHHLPFADGCFHGVWIQAVLEHVLDPPVVANEIYRVLGSDGVVYADTPFMQQVHEGAYDFTRFTLSGQRWLFRRFEEIDSGPAAGAGSALLWSLRYFLRALGAGNRVATVLTAPFFWLRLLDRMTQRQANADAASGTYFLGRKSDTALAPAEMIAYYRRQRYGRGESQV